MAIASVNLTKALNIFGYVASGKEEESLALSRLPKFSRSSGRQLKSWTLNELPQVGEVLGFLERPGQPICLSVFVTKGGVLKTSLTLNLARMTALHNLRTCVVGLDMQGDISSALGSELEVDDQDDLHSALARLNAQQGLSDFYSGKAALKDIILETDIPTLHYIPETPELVSLDQSLINKNRREYWLKENVVDVLKETYDVVILDCSPNWNRLITNALIACDVLLSPLECKINNYRNLQTFRALMQEFRQDLRVDFSHFFLPTRLSPARKLSVEIYNWYRGHLPNCLETAIRDSVQGEEAVAMRLSLPEYSPSSTAAEEMRTLLKEVWAKLPQTPSPSLRDQQEKTVITTL